MFDIGREQMKECIMLFPCELRGVLLGLLWGEVFLALWLEFFWSSRSVVCYAESTSHGSSQNSPDCGSVG